MIEVRDRVTDRINRARLALEVKRGIRPLLVSFVGFLVAAACAYYVAQNVAQSVYTPTQTVSFTVDDAGGAIKGGRQELRFKGIQAGAIDKIELVHGVQAVITAHVYKRFGPIYRNARATLRPVTALEDMTVDITDRGTKSAGLASPSAPLLAGHTYSSVEAEQVLNAFDPDVRTHLATVLRNLGGGLRGRGDALRTAFVKVVPFVNLAARLSTQLGERARLTRRLVHDTGTLTGELARRDMELRTLVRTGGATLKTLEDGSPDLAATLSELPPTLSTIDSSFAAVRGVLPSLNHAVDALQPTAARLSQGLTAVRRLSAVAHPAVHDLRAPVRQLVPLAAALPPAASHLNRAVTLLRPQTRAINHVTKSVMGCDVALQGFFQWTASLVKFDGAIGGTTGRGDFAAALDTAGSVKDPNVYAPKSCAAGKPIGGEPATGGNLKP